MRRERISTIISYRLLPSINPITTPFSPIPRKSIRDKLLSNGGKKLRVLSAAFRKVDEEGHGFITKDQFKSIVSTRMSKKNNKFDKDEIRWLCNNLKGRKR